MWLKGNREIIITALSITLNVSFLLTIVTCSSNVLSFQKEEIMFFGETASKSLINPLNMLLEVLDIPIQFLN